jgi:hypothetical protein
MRSMFAGARFLFVAVVAMALATPVAAQAAGARNCKLLYAEMETTWMPKEAVEIGWVAGTIDGGVYLKYEDKEPPIDPTLSDPNLVLSMKEGTIQLWVTGQSKFDDDVVVRQLSTLRAVGTGIYANLRIDAAIDGKYVVGKGGGYTLHGLLCTPRPRPTG